MKYRPSNCCTASGDPRSAVLQKKMAALQEKKLQEGQQLVKEAEKL